MKEFQPITLETLADGAPLELFEKCLESIVSNIQDINTEPKAKREITIKMVFEPSNDRSSFGVNVTAQLKLAGLVGAEGVGFIQETAGGFKAIAPKATQASLDFGKLAHLKAKEQGND